MSDPTTAEIREWFEKVFTFSEQDTASEMQVAEGFIFTILDRLEAAEATIKLQSEAIEAAKNLVADWRNYRGGYTDDEFTEVGKAAVSAHENNAGQLAKALSKAEVSDE